LSFDERKSCGPGVFSQNPSSCAASDLTTLGWTAGEILRETTGLPGSPERHDLAPEFIEIREIGVMLGEVAASHAR
jgi:hypothetical protein